MKFTIVYVKLYNYNRITLKWYLRMYTYRNKNENSQTYYSIVSTNVRRLDPNFAFLKYSLALVGGNSYRSVSYNLRIGGVDIYFSWLQVHLKHKDEALVTLFTKEVIQVHIKIINKGYLYKYAYTYSSYFMLIIYLTFYFLSIFIDIIIIHIKTT